jgi:hypothetical protein
MSLKYKNTIKKNYKKNTHTHTKKGVKKNEKL